MLSDFKMRRKIALVLLCGALSAGVARAQQFGLYRTGTLYDSFENPSQSFFITDSSRRYAFNFLIPGTHLNASAQGPALPAFKRWAVHGNYHTTTSSYDLDIKETKTSSIFGHQNIYLLAFKIFNRVKYHREAGFSWQVRSDTYAKITNQSAILFDSFEKISDAVNNGTPLPDNMFKTKAYDQQYHQFSFTWRENYTRRLAYGFKLSYLSGIYYGRVDVDRASYDNSGATEKVILGGQIRSTLKYSPEKDIFYPGFKNPGLSAGFSVDYHVKPRWGLTFNAKDIGFIRWNKNSFEFKDSNYEIDAEVIENRLWEELKDRMTERSFISPVNGKIETMIDYKSTHYLPFAYISKNIFYPGMDVGMVNRLRFGILNLSLLSNYNLNNYFRFGGQLLLKSPNVDFYIGSDQLVNTRNTSRAFINSDVSDMPGNVGSSVYFGFSLKFGRVMSRWQMDNYTPGIVLKNERRRGILSKIFGQRN